MAFFGGLLCARKQGRRGAGPVVRCLSSLGLLAVVAIVTFLYQLGCHVLATCHLRAWLAGEAPLPVAAAALAATWQASVVLLVWSYASVVGSDPGFVSEDLSVELRRAVSSRRVQLAFPGVAAEGIKLLPLPATPRRSSGDGGSEGRGAGGDDLDGLDNVVHHGPLFVVNEGRIGRAVVRDENGVAVAGGEPSSLHDYVQRYESKERQRQAWRRDCGAVGGAAGGAAGGQQRRGLGVPDGLKVGRDFLAGSP